MTTMGWSYADWAEQPTAALRLARLRLHISEVSQRQGGAASVSAQGRSMAPDTTYLSMLLGQRDALERQAGSGKRGLVRMVRP